MRPIIMKAVSRNLSQFINESKDPIHPDIIYFEVIKENCELEVAMQYTQSYSELVLGYANNINTTDGGTHIVGFKSALTRVFNDYGKKNKILKDSDDALTGEDVREGLTAIVSVKLERPQFEGQTKAKLGNPDIRGFVETSTNENLTAFLEEILLRPRPFLKNVSRQPEQEKQPEKPGTLPGEKALWTVFHCLENWLTAQIKIRQYARSSWSREIRPEAAPKTAETGSVRRYFLSVERS